MLGIDAARIPDKPSLAYDQILEGVLSRRDPWALDHRHQHRPFVDQPGPRPRPPRPARLPRRPGHVRVDRDRATRADLVLPAAGWGEKTGTFINSERRIGARAAGGRPARRGAGRTSRSSGRWPRRGAAVTWSREWTDPGGGVRRPPAARRPDGRSTSPACRATTTCWPAAACSGRAARPRRPTSPSAACSRTAATSRRRAGPGSCSTSRCRSEEPLSARYPLVLLTGRGSSAPVAHRHPHVEVGDPALAVTAAALRADRAGRRRAPAGSPPTTRSSS